MSCYPILFFEREITAIVLSGGLSTRMGSDKGLLRNSGGIVWAEKMVSICQELNLPTVVSINQGQREDYEAVFAREQLLIDIYPSIGPLGGLLSAHDYVLDHDLLVLSCDMQDLDATVLYEVLKYHDKLGEYDAVVPFQEAFYQPFPGLYSAELLRKVSILYHTGQLENQSMQNIFNTFMTYELQLPEQLLPKLKSYNSIADFRNDPI